MDSVTTTRSKPVSLRGSLPRWIHAHVIYPGIVRARGEGAVFKILREMQRVERAPEGDLSRRQAERLVSLLEYAAGHTEYYRDVLSATAPWDESDVRERLTELPLVTKGILQQNVAALRAEPQPSPVTRKTTGGSTGQPVTVYKDRAAIAHEMAASWMGYGWLGVRVGDRAVRFWGSPHTLKRRLRFAAADFAMHRIRFSAFAFDETHLERYWRRCLRFRPDYFYGYVSMLEAFARFVASRGYDGAALGLKSIITTSEVLSSAQRALLTKVFGAPVQNEYGCGEVGPIAYECERGSLHVMSENLYVEVVTPEGRAAEAGESGEIVVTDLNNRAMPIIRYRLGDFAVRGRPCSCGRGFPTLEKIWGRAYDFVEAPAGRRYHGEYFMYAFEDMREKGVEIRQFQVIQRSATNLDVRVVVPEPADVACRRIEAALAETVPGMTIRVQSVPAIERAASGKMRVIQNLVRGN